MARFLFAPMPIIGHINPGLPIAKELVRRGHDVRWYSNPGFRDKIERTGARFVSSVHAMDLEAAEPDELFPGRSKLQGIKLLQHDMKALFIDFARGALKDLEEEFAREPFDVIVGDNTSGTCGLMHERYGLPWGVYGITVFTLASKDTAPFGLALPPNASAMGRVRNAALGVVTNSVIFGEVNRYYQQTRQELGFERSELPMFEFSRLADVYLQSGAPSFEYPRTDLPENVRFVGAIVPEPPKEWTRPSWWSELDSGRKVVLVTQGTVANEYDDLIRPAIRALADEDALVIVTTGSKPASAVEIDPLPANVRVEQFIPYAELMPKVDVLVTNGGFGSVQIAVTEGVPVVTFGATEEKPEIVARVNWSGLGIGLKVRRPSEQQIRDSVREVLSSPSYAARAREMQAEVAEYDAAKLSADALEEIAPVRRRAVAI